MSTLIAFALFIAAMLVSLVTGIHMVFPILLGLAMFSFLGWRGGFTPRQLAAMAWDKGKKVLVVIRIFVFIGAITALWRSCGTIAFFIYYGIRIITPPLFVLVTFLLTALISFALGTSLGVVSTAGIILMALARSGGVSELVTAGAILSGAYFGDRCSPASSSASLVAAVTETSLYDNLRAMLKTGLLPLVVTTLVYGVLSMRHPIVAVDEEMMRALASAFRITPWALLPAALMMLLSLLKVPIRHAMGWSVLAAAAVTLLVQRMDVWEMLKAVVMGYVPADAQMARIVSGGGLVSMWKPALLVFTTALYSGILDGTGVMRPLQKRLEKPAEKWGLFPVMTAVSLLCGMVFCNQSIVVMMAQQTMDTLYVARGASKSEEAIDIENSGILLSAAIPWNIACSIPLSMLGVGAGAVPYAVLLFLTPLCWGLTKKYVYPSRKTAPKENVP